MHKTKKLRRFTLVELIVSMAVFALLSMMVVQLFSATQKLWVNDVQKNEINAEGRMALDLIASLLTSSYTSPSYTSPASGTTVAIGCDYFELNNARGGKAVRVFDPETGNDKDTSQLGFATKTLHPGMTDNTTTEKLRFVFIEVAKISGSNDPDDGRNVLVVGNLTNSQATAYKSYFPDSTGLDYNYFAPSKDAPFTQTISANTSSVSRIASNVVDFQVVAYNSANDLADGTGSSSTSAMPAAVEVTLVLMDRTHYDIFRNSTDTAAKKLLYDQYARTFRRTIFLNGDVRERDIGSDM